MTLTIENNILDEIGLSQKDIIIEIAIRFYKRGMLSIGQSSKLAGLYKIDFQRELGKRNEFLNYDVSDLEEDLQVLKNFNK
jgi:predicted HTH domain antitoxin